VSEFQAIFGEIFWRVETYISDYSSDILAPIVGWHPGQLSV